MICRPNPITALKSSVSAAGDVATHLYIQILLSLMESWQNVWHIIQL